VVVVYLLCQKKYNKISIITRKEQKSYFINKKYKSIDVITNYMENIDKIVYINLEKREDRRKEIENELYNYNLDGERFEGIYEKPPRGILGCLKSHLSVLKMAKEKDYKNVLIVEDDFYFVEEENLVKKNMKLLFKKKPEFDVCFLSYHLHEGVVDRDDPFLTKVIFSTTASGYIVNNHYYGVLIDLYEDAVVKLENTMEHWNYANDQVWKELQRKDNWYCFTKRLGKQRDGFSDNSNTEVEMEC